MWVHQFALELISTHCHNLLSIVRFHCETSEAHPGQGEDVNGLEH